MKKKIFIITSSRADYSPLKNLIHAFEESKLFKTFIIATGQHLDKKSGNTINEIKKNHKVKIRKVKIQYKKFSENDISFYISQMIKKFSLLLKKNRPHLIMILGDRYEVLSFALAAVQFRIPIAHIHGGEVTKGSLDNTYRNILTKISNIHFVCHNDYKRRVIQMGEDPKLVFNFGSPSLETKKNQIKKNIDRKIFKFIKNKNTYIITYHPNTIFPKATTKELDNLLQAIENFDNLNFIFSYPNFDNFNSEIVKKINSFSKNRKNVRIIKSIGKEKYFIFLRMVAGLIGNSSSSILESSSFKLPCLNIGSRQEGRIMTKNVISCDFSKQNIIKGIKKISSKSFQNSLSNLRNPFYKKNTSLNIYKKIKSINLNKVINKNFFDMV